MKTAVENLFDQTMSKLIVILEDFSAQELNEIPFPGSWTAGQVGEHLFRSYGVIETLKGNVVATTRCADEKTFAIKTLFLDFNIKMESPEAILPSKDYINKDQLILGLKKRVSQFTDLIKKEDLSLICTDFSIQEYGSFTRLEWVYFTIYHTMRHLYQLEQIKEKLTA